MNALHHKPTGILRKGISLFYFIPILLIFLIAFFFMSQKKEQQVQSKVSVNHQASAADISMFRLNGFQLTKPLLLSNPNEESSTLRSLKVELTGYIQDMKNQGVINTASVHIRHLMSGEWTCVNPDEVYVAGSMMKIPTMMAFLKDAETHAGLLDKKIFYDKVPNDMSIQTFNSGSISTGKSYTIRELIDYMITKSDNHATMLLDKNLSYDQINRLFTDLDLPNVDASSTYYRVTATQYSRFLEVLFDATYLTTDHANFAMELLTHSAFSTGLASGIPKGVTIAHKFGEAGSEVPGESQLHETGVVFIDDSPYLITVMTKGMDVQKLPAVISEISKRVYSYMLAYKAS